MREKIGIIGGSFDPPHLGHLILAQDAQEALGLDKVIFVPAAASPLKGHAPVATAPVRLALAQAAFGGRAGWEVSDWELKQGGTSYSLCTAEHLHGRFPDAELFWVIGADQLAQLNAWHRIGELARLVRFAVARRTGSALTRPAELSAAVDVQELPARCMDISSTEVRTRLKKGLPVDLFLPEKVLQVIERGNLYR
ncbi:MAG: nicotinate-nucleotide adenylyltransferase [Puniceicoccales bacterium]|jgi:nicotinate-nucleotide adenylyltransferase|nr:nicotinate-nucleotide adenylyltransferase [Puniceicoccales bacterium]